MNLYLALILLIIIGGTILDLGVELLNTRALDAPVPDELRGLQDPAQREKSIAYQRENFRFATFRQLFMTAVIVAFILCGGFNAVDLTARHWVSSGSPIRTGLVFTGLLAALRGILQLPFTVYDTFVIEEKYGFNRTTPRTFVLDLVRGIALGSLLGAPILAGLIYFFERAGSLGWVYSWIAVTIFQLILLFIAPAVIMPLFNRFTPLPEGELSHAVRDYADRAHFKLQGVFTMDSSRRTTKSNAFFTGFGKFRRLVLFDSLIEKHTVEELVAIFAHEVGHYKLKHIPKMIGLSIGSTGVLFFVLSLLLNNAGLFAAFGMENVSVYASLIFAGFLYSPISRVISIGSKILSRKAEFEADQYSVQTYGKPVVLAEALKKLSVDNLSHLTPHPVKVFLDYTHPPVVDRVRVLTRGHS